MDELSPSVESNHQLPHQTKPKRLLQVLRQLCTHGSRHHRRIGQGEATKDLAIASTVKVAERQRGRRWGGSQHRKCRDVVWGKSRTINLARGSRSKRTCRRSSQWKAKVKEELPARRSTSELQGSAEHDDASREDFISPLTAFDTNTYHCIGRHPARHLQR
ncbi:hypothetical protein H310_06001 [Aphanomyces invadans]|uniref:Uncharacterized protein n=1 Tax=Aphanomyces invadans TaxID=157072 RepID=A0A024U9F2_9STRA|nr:hypothetical protein H310_06001 [Aphanomyces invadans]ETW02502.1 hypothetical protein H310_06001 [Aphanomyces invadans]|eukprot:XP_008869107.1 hypothetical protein H310_06001 [Aphanomyces invadans]